MDYRDSFILFKNDKKSDKSPDYTGKITLSDGTEKRLAAWIKDGKNGKFLSGKLSDIEDKPARYNSSGASMDRYPNGDRFDNDVPF